MIQAFSKYMDDSKVFSDGAVYIIFQIIMTIDFKEWNK